MSTFSHEVIPGDKLKTTELYELLRLRIEVFTVEQNCPYQDLDGQDLGSDTYHIFLRKRHKSGIKGDLVGYIRVVYNNPEAKQVQIGRVVVAKKYRGLSLGRLLLDHGVRFVDAIVDVEPERACRTAMLHGQSHLRKFYESYGFEVKGEEFLEDGIPHLEMVKKLRD